MTIIKQQIPEIEGVADTKAASILRGMKNIIDGITGRRIKPITSLGTNPSVSGIRNKINEIIARLQGDENAPGINDPTVNQTLSVGTATAAAHAVRLDQLPSVLTGSPSVNAIETSTNLSVASNFFNARINTTSGSTVYSPGTAFVIGNITGTSCTVDLYYNNTTAYMQQTLTFPTSGTYLIFCIVTVSTYLTNYRNSLAAWAIRIA